MNERNQKPGGQKTNQEQLHELADVICDKYCKYPEIALGERKDPDEANELLWETYCVGCPLSML